MNRVGQDDPQAELLRLRRELLSFVVAEITEQAERGEARPLAGQIAAAIAAEANAATQAELRTSAERLADAVIAALEPHLAARIPALIEPAVAAALAAYDARQPRRIPGWMLGVLVMVNLIAIMVTALLFRPG